MCTRPDRRSVATSLLALREATVAILLAFGVLLLALVTIPLRWLQGRRARHVTASPVSGIDVQVHLEDRKCVTELKRVIRQTLRRAARTWARLPLPVDRVVVGVGFPIYGKVDLYDQFPERRGNHQAATRPLVVISLGLREGDRELEPAEVAGALAAQIQAAIDDRYRQRTAASQAQVRTGLQPALPDARLTGSTVNDRNSEAKEGEQSNTDEAANDAAHETIRDLFRQALTHHNVPDNALTRASVTDLNLTEKIEESIQIYLQSDPLTIASCFDTAARLVQLLGADGRDVKAWSMDGIARDVLPTVIADLRVRRRTACIYRLGINRNAHGFTVIVRNEQAEILQGFAGREGESLAMNLDRPGSFEIDALIQLLQALIGDDRDASRAAQTQLFDGFIDLEVVPATNKTRVAAMTGDPHYTRARGAPRGLVWFYRNMARDDFEWERRPLHDEATIRRRVGDKIEANLRVLADLQRARRESPGPRKRRKRG